MSTSGAFLRCDISCSVTFNSPDWMAGGENKRLLDCSGRIGKLEEEQIVPISFENAPGMSHQHHHRHHSDHPARRTITHRPWTSSFSVRSLLAPRPCPRPLTGALVVAPAPAGPPLGCCSAARLQGSTLIEKYIYSLPEYRLHERQRRNFIEIHSFNGLLATRKVIGNIRLTRSSTTAARSGISEC